MLRSHLTDAFALLLCLCAPLRSTNAQAPETHILPVTVVTVDGRPVTNLQSHNVHIHGGGAQVKSFSLDTDPRRIVLLLDTSGSMGINDNGKLRLAVASELMNLFLDTVPAGDSLALYQFADSPREVIAFTHDAAAIRQAISSIPVDRERDMVGRTNIRDALNAILTNPQESLAFGDSIVIFSDGEWNSDEDKQRSLASLASALVQDGVRIFLVLTQEKSAISSESQTPPTGVNQPVPAPGHLPPQGQSIVVTFDYEKTRIVDSELFVDAVGGESFAPADPNVLQSTTIFRSNDLRQRMKSLCAALQSAYRLELELFEPLRSKKRLHINLVDGRGKPLHNVAVLSPEFVYPDDDTHP
jgi:Mg-chelatase subunit ChlD